MGQIREEGETLKSTANAETEIRKFGLKSRIYLGILQMPRCEPTGNRVIQVDEDEVNATNKLAMVF